MNTSGEAASVGVAEAEIQIFALVGCTSSADGVKATEKTLYGTDTT